MGSKVPGRSKVPESKVGSKVPESNVGGGVSASKVRGGLVGPVGGEVWWVRVPIVCGPCAMFCFAVVAARCLALKDVLKVEMSEGKFWEDIVECEAEE